MSSFSLRWIEFLYKPQIWYISTVNGIFFYVLDFK